jgi:hypothetical protein
MRPRLLALTAILSMGLALSLGPAQAKPPPARGGAAQPAPKEAAPQHEVVVTVLYASNSKKGIDQRIGNMPELKSPPFSSYDSYELLLERRMPLAKGKPGTLRLPNGRVLQTALVDVLAKKFVRLSASINQPGGKDFLPLLEVKAKLGQAFIVAGQRYQSGILVLVIRVVELPPPAAPTPPPPAAPKPPPAAPKPPPAAPKQK